MKSGDARVALIVDRSCTLMTIVILILWNMSRDFPVWVNLPFYLS